MVRPLLFESDSLNQPFTYIISESLPNATNATNLVNSTTVDDRISSYSSLIASYGEQFCKHFQTLCSYVHLTPESTKKTIEHAGDWLYNTTCIDTGMKDTCDKVRSATDWFVEAGQGTGSAAKMAWNWASWGGPAVQLALIGLPCFFLYLTFRRAHSLEVRQPIYNIIQSNPQNANIENLSSGSNPRIRPSDSPNLLSELHKASIAAEMEADDSKLIYVKTIDGKVDRKELDRICENFGVSQESILAI